MPIKLAPRARVDQAVLDAYAALAREKLEQIRREAYMYAGRPAQRQQFLNKNKAALARLSPIVRGENGAGIGLDFELSRLRSLDYESIVLRSGYIIGYTRDPFFIEELDGDNHVAARWDSGPYACCLPLEVLQTKDMTRIHFIPSRSPQVENRHMHHYAAKVKNAGPLRWTASTCWSGFSEPISGALADLDLVEVMRMLRIFVGRYNPRSPLRRPGQCDDMRFMTRLA